MHGGLRYLRSADVRRMRESIRERSALLRIAPLWVQPQPFLVGLGDGLLDGPLAFRAALCLSDLIVTRACRRIEKFRPERSLTGLEQSGSRPRSPGDRAVERRYGTMP